MKMCRSCNTEKEYIFFHRRSASIDGLSAMCKECQKEYDKKRANNPSRVKARKEYAKTPEGKLAAERAKKKYLLVNKNKVKESNKKYRDENRDKIKSTNARYYEENKLRISERVCQYRDRFPNKYKAHIAIGNAIRDGKIEKKDICEECGLLPSYGSLHGHHDDYAFPLSVRWLCPGCHTKWHKENGEGKNA